MGVEISKEILKEVGVNPKPIYTTPVRGAHPGATAPIGKTVDRNQQTEIEGLYISDASIIPKATGIPPVLTIIALSKRLSKIVAQ